MSAVPVALNERIRAVQAAVASVCARAGRSADSITLVAVSKTHSPETIVEAVRCGLTHFGENRVEEASVKIPAVMALLDAGHPPITWHMVGHVQSRKAADVIAAFDIIHSLDSVKLAERYARFQAESGRAVPVLLEVNVSGEDNKSGFNCAAWQQQATQRQAFWDAVRHMAALPGLQVSGLMTMAPIVDDMEQTRPVFRALRTLRDALAEDFPQQLWAHLSMGMTDDYPVAIEEGATIVRIGRAIFGERQR